MSNEFDDIKEEDIEVVPPEAEEEPRAAREPSVSIEKLARALAPVRSVDHDPAAHDPVVKFVELGGFFIDVRFDRFGRRDIAEGNL